MAYIIIWMYLNVFSVIPSRSLDGLVIFRLVIDTRVIILDAIENIKNSIISNMAVDEHC